MKNETTHDANKNRTRTDGCDYRAGGRLLVAIPVGVDLFVVLVDTGFSYVVALYKDKVSYYTQKEEYSYWSTMLTTSDVAADKKAIALKQAAEKVFDVVWYG